MVSCLAVAHVTLRLTWTTPLIPNTASRRSVISSFKLNALILSFFNAFYHLNSKLFFPCKYSIHWLDLVLFRRFKTSFYFFSLFHFSRILIKRNWKFTNSMVSVKLSCDLFRNWTIVFLTIKIIKLCFNKAMSIII